MSSNLNELTAAVTDLSAHLLPAPDSVVRRVTIAEDLHDHRALGPAALVLLSRAASEAAEVGYALDIFLRRAAEQGVIGVVLRGNRVPSVTALSLARKSKMALLATPPGDDTSDRLMRLSAAIDGGARESVARLSSAAMWLDRANDDLEVVLEEAASRFAVPLAFEPGGDGADACVEVEGRRIGRVVTDELNEAAAIAARFAAASLSRLLTRRARSILSPVRSEAAIIGQLLHAPPPRLELVVQRSREFGIQIDGYHCTVRLHLGDVATIVGSDAPALHELEDEILGEAVRMAATKQRQVMGARSDDTLILVSTSRVPPSPSAGRELARYVSDVIDAIEARYPDLAIEAGLGTWHRGAAGLRTSAAEALTALASVRATSGDERIAAFDALGVRRMLAEWLASETARQTVNDLLAPLDALGAEKADTAIRTLHVYLDERGSLQRTAERLHLHRNAVVYRVSRLSQTLGDDLSDPERRFALQLACRARLLTSGRTI